MYFMRCVKIYRRRTTFAPILASAMDDLSNLSKRKLGRRDATGFKKLPHPDDFLLWTLWNLDRAGYEGWAKLVTRPDDPHPTVEAFKTEERRKLAEAGYTIIATVGDQESDLEGGFAECSSRCQIVFTSFGEERLRAQ